VGVIVMDFVLGFGARDPVGVMIDAIKEAQASRRPITVRWRSSATCSAPTRIRSRWRSSASC
jgi:hypothetical protein